MRLIGILGMTAAVAGFFLLLAAAELPGVLLLLGGLAAVAASRFFFLGRELRSRMSEWRSLSSRNRPPR